MKKIILILAVVLLLPLTSACSKDTQGMEPVLTATPSASEQSENRANDGPTPTAGLKHPTATPNVTPTSKPSIPKTTPTPFPVGEVDRTPAFELLSKMNVGWNLGNTFDSHGTKGLGAETYWGNPKTTQAMIDAIADKGFNTIRIPVTFANHISSAPDYTIDAAWLSRIKEVIDYAYNDEMYVIIDTHHEPDYWLKPGIEYRETVTAELTAIWKQLAEYFKEYDEHLIFEGMNEPRTKNSANEWNGGTNDERESINIYNKAFVDTVRATGGNNETRLLIICPYGNSVTTLSLFDLDIPDDPNICVAVHLYTPYYFTYDAKPGGYFEWTYSRKNEITTVFNTVKRDLLDKGVPAIVTEFGAVCKTQKVDGKTVNNSSEVLEWLDDYMGIANKYGITCVWWDNGNYSSSGERFAIFNRRTCGFYDDAIADKLVELGNIGIRKEN